MGAEAGGKLRNSILMGMGSEPIMAAVRSLALICDSSLWTLLRARVLHVTDAVAFVHLARCCQYIMTHICACHVLPTFQLGSLPLSR